MYFWAPAVGAGAFNYLLFAFGTAGPIESALNSCAAKNERPLAVVSLISWQ